MALKSCLCSEFAAAVLFLAAGTARADGANPFVPPSQREADREYQLQQRLDKAVGELEGRIIQSLVNSIEGRAPAGSPEEPLVKALKRALGAAQPAAPGASGSGTGTGGGAEPPARGALPALPPLPGTTAKESQIPPGASFIGCLDRKAFFQDRSGSPFLVDPSAFPSSVAGPGACAR